MPDPPCSGNGLRHWRVSFAGSVVYLPCIAWQDRPVTQLPRNKVLDNILATGQFTGRDGQLIKIRAEVSTELGDFLQGIIRDLKPRHSLEVGLAYGVSAMFICDALKSVGAEQHIVMDSHQMTPVWNNGAGLDNLRDAGYESLIEFHGEESQRALPKLVERGQKIDFAFIDGAHTFDHALVDFFYIDKILNIGGIVVFDDVGFQCIDKVCRFILKNRNYRVHSRLSIDNMSRTPAMRRFLYGAVRSIARVSSRIRGLLAPRILETTSELGLDGWCVAFVKEAEDTRGYTQDQVRHRDF